MNRTPLATTFKMFFSLITTSQPLLSRVIFLFTTTNTRDGSEENIINNIIVIIAQNEHAGKTETITQNTWPAR